MRKKSLNLDKKGDFEIVSTALGGARPMIHNCDILERSDVDISIQTIKCQWYWVFWGKSTNEAHAIKFCPYCGKKL